MGTVPIIGSGHQLTASSVRRRTQTPPLVAAAEAEALVPRTLLRRIGRPHVAVPAIGLILFLVLATVWFFNRQAKIRWAREVALPEVERLIEASWRDFTEAYKLAEQAEEFIPNDPEPAALFSKSSFSVNIRTEPASARTYLKEYKSPDSEWEYLGAVEK